MKVLLSTGLGRLHLVQSATHLAQHGVDVALIQGWSPRDPDSLLVRLLARLSGHKHLAAGLRKRRPEEFRGTIRTCAFAEFLHTALVLSSRKTGLPPMPQAASWAWSVFGGQTKRHLRDADVFHVRSGAGGGGAIEAAKRRGMKVVVDHSIAHPAFMKRVLKPEYDDAGAEFSLGPTDPLWARVLADCEAADVLLVSSDFVKQTFIEAGMRPEKIRVAYLGVRDDFHALKQSYALAGRLRLVFTGSFGIRKGAKYILQALQMLDQQGVDYEFTVAGATNEAAGIIERFPVKGSVRFVGHIPQDNLKKLLAKSDIYLFPSLCEGFSSSLFEAMSAGVPVITTIESTARITDGVDGSVVPSKDAQAIADKIIWLRNNPAEFERIGRNAAQLVRDRYTWDRYAQEVINVYKELVGRPSGIQSRSATSH
jgi:glycosyltransferase involved in cell wall biosynthesis